MACHERHDRHRAFCLPHRFENPEGIGILSVSIGAHVIVRVAVQAWHGLDDGRDVPESVHHGKDSVSDVERELRDHLTHDLDGGFPTAELDAAQRFGQHRHVGELPVIGQEHERFAGVDPASQAMLGHVGFEVFAEAIMALGE